MGAEVLWRPNAGRQTQFLASPAYEALYGGQAGGGKSDALCMAPLRYVHLPHYRAVLFRRTYGELEKSLISKSLDYYPELFPDARWNDTKHFWHFPQSNGGPGARIYFSHLQHQKDVHDHQSAEYQFLGFDELTSFTKEQYTYMLSRVRTSKTGLRLMVRSATNPGNVGHEWVREFWAPWLIPAEHNEYAGPIVHPSLGLPGVELAAVPGTNDWRPVATDGQLLHIVVQDDREYAVPAGTKGALSRTFIPASVKDNPKLVGDEAYQASLNRLDPVTRKQLKEGDWLIKPGAGKYFQRAWCLVASALEVPAGIQWFRFWDFAGTEKTEAKKGKPPDATAGVKLGLDAAGRIWIADCVHFRGSPQTVEERLVKTAELDGLNTIIGFEQDPGQAGKHQGSAFVRLLNGYRVKRYSPTGDKLQRFGPFSSQAEGGRVVLVNGPWLNTYCEELEAFPEGSFDDQVDGTSGAYMMASGGPKSGGLYLVKSGR